MSSPVTRAAPPSPDADGGPTATPRALIIDDDPGSCALAGLLLRRQGFAVTCAEDGEQGLALARTSVPAFDVVLLDWCLPRMTGRETLETLRAVAPRVPVVVVSGNDMSQPSEPGDVLPPGVPFLLKPFRPDGLAAALAQTRGAPGG